MGQRLLTKRQTIRIPSATAIAINCGWTQSCCEDAATPSDTCGRSIPTQVIMTLTAETPTHVLAPRAFYTLQNSGTYCGEAYQEGTLECASGWNIGSFPLNYVGLFHGGGMQEACTTALFSASCDYHVYAFSKGEIPDGQFISGGTTIPLLAVLAECQTDSACPQLYHVHDASPHYQMDDTIVDPAALCAQPIGPLQIPCDINILYQDCGGGPTVHWASSTLLTACIGEPCPIPIPNGDIYGGLYCDPTNIQQYPTAIHWHVYRQAFYCVPAETASDSGECCSLAPLLFIKTYVVRYRSMNQAGDPIILGEPSVFTYGAHTTMNYSDSITLNAVGDQPLCDCDPAVCGLSGQCMDVEISA